MRPDDKRKAIEALLCASAEAELRLAARDYSRGGRR